MASHAAICQNFQIITQTAESTYRQLGLLVKQSKSLPDQLTHTQPMHLSSAIKEWSSVINSLTSSSISSLQSLQTILPICTRESLKEVESSQIFSPLIPDHGRGRMRELLAVDVEAAEEPFKMLPSRRSDHGPSTSQPSSVSGSSGGRLTTRLDVPQTSSPSGQNERSNDVSPSGPDLNIAAESEERDSSIRRPPTLEDPWEWRKYGQKMLRDNTQYRSYLRCAVKTCPAKKVIDFDQNGRSKSEATSAGHNHEKPSKTSRLKYVYNRESQSFEEISTVMPPPARAPVPRSQARNRGQGQSAINDTFSNYIESSSPYMPAHLIEAQRPKRHQSLGLGSSPGLVPQCQVQQQVAVYGEFSTADRPKSPLPAEIDGEKSQEADRSEGPPAKGGFAADTVAASDDA